MRSQNYIKSVPVQAVGREVSGGDEVSSALKLVRDLIAALTTAAEATETMAAREVNFVGTGIDFFAEVSRFEVQMITQALRLARGSQIKAARLLGLNATTLNSKIKAYKIDWKTR